MAITHPKDTLAYHQSRALTRAIRRAEVPCHQVAKRIALFIETPELAANARPEHEALTFYGLAPRAALSADLPIDIPLEEAL